MYAQENGKLNKVYELFDEFIDAFLLSKKNFLTGDGTYTSDDLKAVHTHYVDDSKNEKDKPFDEKLRDQVSGLNPAQKRILAHATWLWCFAVHDMTVLGKSRSVAGMLEPTDGETFKSQAAERFPKQGIGSAGQWHKQNKYWEIRFNVLLIETIRGLSEAGDPRVKDKESVKRFILDLVYGLKYDAGEYNEKFKWVDPHNERALVMYNLLLHLCAPDDYERIFSNAHKKRICDTFSFLISDDDGVDDVRYDDNLKLIRAKLSPMRSGDFDFYSDELLERMWNTSSSSLSFDEVDALRAKKQIVLYGPPGTGKTYDARKLANSFLVRNEIRRAGEGKEAKLREILGSARTEEGLAARHRGRVRVVQLHGNYSYDEFIWGLRLEKGETVPKKGIFLELCDEAMSNSDKDYVLILDEINRVDLSRLFGEAFSALEYRDDDIALSWAEYKLRVPNNLYVIGTMNEIDFSLERIDFALRRRFVWFEHSYDEAKLKQIIDHKIEAGAADPSTKNAYSRLRTVEADIWNGYAERCSELNALIEDNPDLGSQYLIGHTFFAEIADYLSNYAGESGYSGAKLARVNLYKSGGPAEALWQFSLEPMILAFLGSMDNKTRATKVKAIKDKFLHAGKK